VDVDLFIKKMPSVIKELIGREAFENRRSVNQEAISLLEEALVARVGASGNKRKRIEAYLEGHADTNPAATPADSLVMPVPPTSLMS
jgi:Arc/MetJ-type ribon-helix-helix transcriptional regulator